MSLFKKQIENIKIFLDEKHAQNKVRTLDIEDHLGWPAESSLVLEEDTALEMGNPAVGSLSFMLWSEDFPEKNEILLIGPDIKEIEKKSSPLCRIILVRGRFGEEYELYRETKDAVLETKLKGFMVRELPSRQTFWCRVNREALDKGLSLAHLGAALMENLKNLDYVEAASVIFITSGKNDIERVKDTGYEAGRILSAMTKMFEEMKYDCESCEYWDVCETVIELKKIRDRLQEETAR